MVYLLEIGGSYRHGCLAVIKSSTDEILDRGEEFGGNDVGYGVISEWQDWVLHSIEGTGVDIIKARSSVDTGKDVCVWRKGRYSFYLRWGWNGADGRISTDALALRQTVNDGILPVVGDSTVCC